jgi:hypothetical protein
MSKLRHGQAGFSTIEIIIVIAVLALGVVAGLLVHKNRHKSAGVTTLSATSSSSAGWSSYCDTIHNGCFKYPSNWSLTTSNKSGQTNVKVYSPGRTAIAMYTTIPANIATAQSNAAFYAVSTSNVAASNPSLKVVAGYFTSSDIPYYYLVNASSLKTYPLTAAKTSQFEGIPDYKLMNSTDFGSFYAYSARGVYSGSTAKAQSWYSTTDAKNAQLIIQSFHYQ